jgi:hypothetical protein
VVKLPTRKVSLKGKAQYGPPPCTNNFSLAPFYTKIIIYIFLQKQATLMRRLTVLRTSPQIAFPDSTHNPKAGGSNPAHGAWRGKIAKMSSKLNRSMKKKVFETFSFERK